MNTPDEAAAPLARATVRRDLGAPEGAAAPLAEATVCAIFDTAEEAAAALTQATVRGDFGGVQRAVKQFSKLLVRAAAAVPSAEALRRLDDACSLIEWSRRNLCAARAHVVEEIRRLDSICQYHQRLAVTQRAWRESGDHALQ